jgi:hypothetical protein
MIVVGPIIIIMFGVYEAKWAKYPIIPAHILKNKAVMAASLIGFFDFASPLQIKLISEYSYSADLVLLDILVPLLVHLRRQNTSMVTRTTKLFHQHAKCRFNRLCYSRCGYHVLYSSLQVAPLHWLVSPLLGCRYHDPLSRCPRNVSTHIIFSCYLDWLLMMGRDGEVVFTQILQAFGGGFASVASQVGAQASVRHKYVAMVTAIVLLITELGGAIGSAIGTALSS